MNDYPTEGRDGFPLIHLPDIPWGAEAWALIELEISADLAKEPDVQLLQAAVSGATIDGTPIACQDATLALEAVPPQAWEALLPDALVLARQAELEAGQLLGQARAAAEYGDWATIQRMIAAAQQRFADHPWVQEVLAEMAELAAVRDSARFRKEALYSSRNMDRRLAAKAERLAGRLCIRRIGGKLPASQAGTGASPVLRQTRRRSLMGAGRYIGYDPGGDGKHGVAILETVGGKPVTLRTALLKTTEEVIGWIRGNGGQIQGLGIDTLTCWRVVDHVPTGLPSL